MKKETISLTEFANQVKELADDIGAEYYGIQCVIHHGCNKSNKYTYTYTCWIDSISYYSKAKTPQICLSKLKDAINPKRIKDVII